MDPIWRFALVGSAMAAAVAATVGLRSLWVASRRRRLRRLVDRFRFEREQLEAKFFDLARAHASEDWDAADFDGPARFVRDRDARRISALVEVVLLRGPRPASHATAIFHVQRGRWTTQGRMFENLNPEETLERYHDRYEALPRQQA